MNKSYNILVVVLALGLLLFTSCNDDETIIEKQKVAGISLKDLTGNQITITEDEPYTVEIEINPKTAIDIDKYTKFIFTSGNEAIFTIDADGKITTKERGETTLTVTAEYNPEIELVCMVSVIERTFPITSINVVAGLEGAKFMLSSVIDMQEYITVLPDNATNGSLNFTSNNTDVATIDKEGKVTILTAGKAKIKIETADGSGITKDINIEFTANTPEGGFDMDFVALDRTGWKIATSHPFVADATTGGKPEMLIDGDLTKGLSLYKPGKVGVVDNAIVGFTIDAGAEIEFDALKITHRKFYDYIAAQGIDILGSNDGTNFQVIQRGISTPYTTQSDMTTLTVPLALASKYRYIRVEYSKLLTSGGNTVQVMEFELGKGTMK